MTTTTDGFASLLAFFSQMLHGTQLPIFVTLSACAALGMIAHYTSKWANGEIQGNLGNYLFRQNPRATVAAAIAIVAWSAGEVASGIFSSGGAVSWGVVILSGFKTGYVGDSLINKSAQAKP